MLTKGEWVGQKNYKMCWLDIGTVPYCNIKKNIQNNYLWISKINKAMMMETQVYVSLVKLDNTFFDKITCIFLLLHPLS